MAEERTRIADERVEKDRRERAAAEARQSQIRIRVEAEALAAAREHDRRVEEERRRTEEAARLEAIRNAELERVRGETARRMELERGEAERRHELELARALHASGARTARFVALAASVVAFAACTASVYLELGVHPGRLARLEAESAATIRAERDRAERAEISYKTSEAKRRALEEQLRAREAAPTPVVAPAPTVGAPSPRATGRKAPRPGVRPPPCVDDNDPLNPCLGR